MDINVSTPRFPVRAQFTGYDGDGTLVYTFTADITAPTTQFVNVPSHTIDKVVETDTVPPQQAFHPYPTLV